jgi:hypothetical protein
MGWTRKHAVVSATISGRVVGLSGALPAALIKKIVEFAVCWKQTLGHCIHACFLTRNDYTMMDRMIFDRRVLVHRGDFRWYTSEALRDMRYLSQEQARIICDRMDTNEQQCYWRRMFLGSVVLQGPRIWLVMTVEDIADGASFVLRQVGVQALYSVLKAHSIRLSCEDTKVTSSHIADLYNSSSPFALRRKIIREAPVALTTLRSTIKFAYGDAYCMQHQQTSTKGPIFVFKQSTACKHLAMRLPLGASPPARPIFLVS